MDTSLILQGANLATFDRRRAAFLAAIAGALATSQRSIRIHEVGLASLGGVMVKFKVLAGIAEAQTVVEHVQSRAFSRKLCAGLQSHGVHILPSTIVAGDANIVRSLRENRFATESFFLKKQKAAQVQPKAQPTAQLPSPSAMSVIFSNPSLLGMSCLTVTLFGILVAKVLQQQLRETVPVDSDV